MQLPAIRIAHRSGWRVYVADGNPDCPGASQCDRFFPVDLKDTKGLVQIARDADPMPTGVFTAGTDFSASVAYVAQELHLPGTSYESALNASDKARMRGCFSSQHVPSPEFRELSSVTGAEEAVRGLGYPLVVKPVDNMGARGVQKVETAEGIAAAVEQSIRYSRSGRVVVEQFIPGREYSIDAIVWDGEITICGIAERHIYFPPAFIEMGHTIPAELSASIEGDLVDVFCRGVRALGISNGAAKGDIFHTGDGAVIGEIAARLSGGYMSGWTYPYATGHEVTAAALNIAVGLPPGDLSPKRSWVSAERAFLSIPGTLRQIDGVAAARAVPGVKELFLRVAPGDSVRFPRNNVEKCGNVIASASDRMGAFSAAQSALRCIELRLEPNRPETDEFLFSPRTGTTDPHLFEVKAESDIAALDNYRKSFITVRELTAIIRASGANARFPVIEPLPRWTEETTLNWMGMSLADAVGSVVQLHSLELLGENTQGTSLPARQNHESDAFSCAFWLALVRGGLQGVRYLIDSIRAQVEVQ